MARIYTGDIQAVDPEILEAVKGLPDDYWVFAAFNIGRDVDWLIIRESCSSNQPSVMIVTELKRVSRPLRAVSENAAWELQNSSDEWQYIDPSNENDTNYYWQAVHTANALKEWLWNNQRFYSASDEIEAENVFKVWPDLLILSPPGTRHRLPLKPTSKYGQWSYGITEWLGHIRSWQPKFGISLTSSEILKLVEALGLRLVSGVSPITDLKPSEGGHTVPAFPDWLQPLRDRIVFLEDKVKDLECRLNAT
jgi:hypothetical protein